MRSARGPEAPGGSPSRETAPDDFKVALSLAIRRHIFHTGLWITCWITHGETPASTEYGKGRHQGKTSACMDNSFLIKYLNVLPGTKPIPNFVAHGNSEDFQKVCIRDDVKSWGNGRFVGDQCMKLNMRRRYWLARALPLPSTVKMRSMVLRPISSRKERSVRSMLMACSRAASVLPATASITARE